MVPNLCSAFYDCVSIFLYQQGPTDIIDYKLVQHLTCITIYSMLHFQKKHEYNMYVHPKQYNSWHVLLSQRLCSAFVYLHTATLFSCKILIIIIIQLLHHSLFMLFLCGIIVP